MSCLRFTSWACWLAVLSPYSINQLRSIRDTIHGIKGHKIASDQSSVLHNLWKNGEQSPRVGQLTSFLLICPGPMLPSSPSYLVSTPYNLKQDTISSAPQISYLSSVLGTRIQYCTGANSFQNVSLDSAYSPLSACLRILYQSLT